MPFQDTSQYAVNTPDTAGSTKSLLLDRIRDKFRLKHYSIRTETAYVDWVRRFVVFHNRRHPRDLGPEHVEAFLSGSSSILL